MTDPSAGSSDPGRAVYVFVNASGNAVVPVVGTGFQVNQLPPTEMAAITAVTVAPPLGMRDPESPLRGRRHLLDAIVADVESRTSFPRVHVLHGLGGIGKTSVALEVAHLAFLRGYRVWWIDAADQVSLNAGLHALARQVGMNQMNPADGGFADQLWAKLGKFDHPWLLIVNNLDEPSWAEVGSGDLALGRGSIRPVSPGHGSVIVTTRNGSASVWRASWCRRHKVDALSIEDGALLLMDCTGGSAGPVTDAEQLARALGGLPLALNVAGRYLAQSGSLPSSRTSEPVVPTFSMYLASLTNKMDAVSIIPNSLRTSSVWDLSIGTLQNAGETQASALLGILAHMADAPVPELILHTPTLAKSSLFLGLTEGELRRQITVLENFGLAESSATSLGANKPKTRTLRMHPLVRQAVLSKDANRIDLMEVTENLLYQWSVTATVTEPDESLRWSVWQLVAPHALYFEDMSGRSGLSSELERRARRTASVAKDYLSTSQITEVTRITLNLSARTVSLSGQGCAYFV